MAKFSPNVNEDNILDCLCAFVDAWWNVFDGNVGRDENG